MLDFSIYLLYRTASAFVALFPLRFLFRAGELLGFVAWAILGGYRRLAQNNLAIAFGEEKPPRELRRLARKHFQRLGANLLSSLKIGTMPVEKIIGCVTIENPELVHAELQAGRGIVFTLSHLGSWELFAQMFPKHFGYVPNSTVYQKLGNRYIDADVRAKRGRSGVVMFDRKEGFQKAIELLRRGGVIGILSDQHAGDHGLWTPFFGRLASTSPLPGLLAKRAGGSVMAAAIYTTGAARWRMVFTPRYDEPGDPVQAITARTNSVIAAQIRQAPEDWFWVHNRWKTPKPNFLLTRYKRGVYLPGSTPEELKPFRILMRAPNWLGDSVISAAAVRAIKRGRPDAHVTIAAPAKIASTWQLLSEVDDVIPLPNSSLADNVRLLRAQRQFDVAILLPNSLRSALEIWRAGISRRVGFAGHHRRWLLNQVVPEESHCGPIRHQVHRYLHLARTLGADVRNPVFPQPQLRNGSSGKLKLGLSPGAEYGPAKRWLPERFADVAAAVSEKHPATWLLFGTTADSEIGKLIADRLGENCVNRIGQTSLEQLIEELRECRLLLTNDTGTMHLATLVGVPVVAVFGSTEYRLTGPLGERNSVVRHHVECSPCFLRECPIDFRCMNAVSAEEVTERVLGLLAAAQTADNPVASPAHSR